MLLKDFWRTAVCVFSAQALAAQVFIDHNLPRVIPTGERVEADIVIHKPVTREFVQYEIVFQAGLAVQEVNSAGGTFKSDNNRIKIMWSLAPQTPEIRVRMAFVAGAAGTFTLGQKIEYAFEGEQRTATLQDLAIMAQPGAMVADAIPFTRVKQVVPSAIPVTHIDSMEHSLRDPGKAAVHIAQLRRDAREARRVGENELKQAQLEIRDAGRELENSKQVAKQTERAKRVRAAEMRLEKAETNKQIAQKILVLAKTLEENADQIERARRSDSATAATSAVTGAEVKPPVLPEKEISALNDTLYHIQVGAYRQHPGKSPFSALGTVKIVNESGLYKVLLGRFSTREEALSLQRRLAGEGLEGFVVKYHGDRRVK